ncbi:ThiJ/PfpI family protein [Amycolatopsis mediterranei S699]|uniref:ThiJ/PfpI family protein n=2 Tax=Amycolatopsis mediterranei TaxID=33910 RepID=A0A0H3DDY7_AMYMU|nr:DJ-1/PfpI family protein [Amycolatopsis mediterranei]ADJ48263.1 ThiJ/PfpI family protein [Amycolatopsis mediterranei U32]AEK45174.1 ThiJ/PfpI family protein [Amycolatopsis mediterranei S699]AFO79974.1 ThiJ/PfpI family protein [Amycolatopsis mediterranei S699]AGT87102.1 ThiJ/PfpI family protein [Amycolatopsis mediterranei RB]KDO10418.1 thiamine biosynthesis protein ThiJ [Amycolatopsis mediterranei]
MGKRCVSVILFGGFQLLDVFGPVDLLSVVPDGFDVRFVGPGREPVASSQGISVSVTDTRDDAPEPDIILVPGGRGTRTLVRQQPFLTWLAGYARSAPLVTSVCTGSAVLAAAGLLDGYRATSNKRAFDWVTTQGEHVGWVRQARWVEDRNRWPSSGVAAGMDMTAALIRHLHGAEVAKAATDFIEFEAHPDPARDPFAGLAGS